MSSALNIKSIKYIIFVLIFILTSCSVQYSEENQETITKTISVTQIETPVLPQEPVAQIPTSTQDILENCLSEIKVDINNLPLSIAAEIDTIPGFDYDGYIGSDRDFEAGFQNFEGSIIIGAWTYLVVAKFPTIRDEIALNAIKRLWLGIPFTPDRDWKIMVSEETKMVFNQVWGDFDEEYVEIIQADEIMQIGWERENTFAIIPFEQIDPRWKIMRIDSLLPFDGKDYPLHLPIYLHPVSDVELCEGFLEDMVQIGNFDESKLTSVILTGTTALARYTAQRMEEKGVLYPAEDISEWLINADITHISNEVPFYEDCPPANPVRLEARFCSDPSYFALLTHLDIDVIELTGNHILDWGQEPFIYTLDLYKEADIPYYGGGLNLEEAGKPLEIVHNGNKLVFLGCSQAGPEVVWAGEEKAGSNPCNEEEFFDLIEQYLEKDYIPIVTYQHLEVEDYVPHSSQRVDFLNTAKNGAAIVSGSQSHFAQTMTFVGDHFVHFGLGNLFFDQMYGENPKLFIDKHYFYNGEYISTELLTAILEDYAKPRPMTEEEREEFLDTIFSYWLNETE